MRSEDLAIGPDPLSKKDGRDKTYAILSGISVKIGYSSDPFNRLSQIRTNSPDEGNILFLLTSDLGNKIEQILHTRYKEYNRHREWYNLSPKWLIADIGAAIARGELDAQMFTPVLVKIKEEPHKIRSSREGEDELTQEAIEMFDRIGKASVSLMQRRLRVGYNRASRIMEDIRSSGELKRMGFRELPNGGYTK